GASGGVGVGNNGNLLLSGGTVGSGSTYFFYDPVATQAIPIYNPTFSGIPPGAVTMTLGVQSPGGFYGVGSASIGPGHAVLCGGGCFDLGTLSTTGNRVSGASDVNDASVVVGGG